MRLLLLGLLVMLGVAQAACSGAQPVPQPRHDGGWSEVRDRRGDTVPDHARSVAAYVRYHRGEAPPGYRGGAVFQNRERQLPQAGSYREYDVHPLRRGRDRGAERLVRDARTGAIWYTRDHYRSFVEVRP